VANLPPVPLVMFEKLQLISHEREQGKSNEVKKQDHLKSVKRVDGERPISMVADSPKVPGDVDENVDRVHEVDEEELTKKVNVLECFMDGHISADVSENLIYMQRNFGFFIPEADLVKDLDGLIKYCTQKVKAGRICLFCDKPFHSGKATVQHMLAKSHCKIRWETDDDIEEYEDYYDFSQFDLDDDSHLDNPSRSSKSKVLVEMLDTGELMFTDKISGERKIIGTREFHYIYKQRFTPEDTRASVVANSKEKLLLEYRRAGVETGGELAKASYNGGKPSWMNKTMAKQQQRQETHHMKLRMRDSIQRNLLTKNRVAGKVMGAGFGVHG